MTCTVLHPPPAPRISQIFLLFVRHPELFIFKCAHSAGAGAGVWRVLVLVLVLVWSVFQGT